MSNLSQDATFAPRRAWQRLWRGQTLTIARFTIRGYVRSGWILGDIVFIWLLYTLFFFTYGGTVSYTYGTLGEGLSVLAVLDTVVIVQRSLRTARIYMPLARLSSRSAYIRGLIVATAALRVPFFFLTLLLAMSFHRGAPHIGIQGATLLNLLPGMVGVLLMTILISVLTAVLSLPIATRRIQILFLVWLAVVLYSGVATRFASQYLVIVQIPLMPLNACYDLGMSARIDSYGLIMMLLAVGYIVGLTYLAERWMVRRDLLLS
ncbi:MAG TPA: hypothetical protein VKX46_10585 [Ktedonobacteraceae bacterium]|nr:hypothetical protein [Ktedonobacteraceae bacterium]